MWPLQGDSILLLFLQNYYLLPFCLPDVQSPLFKKRICNGTGLSCNCVSVDQPDHTRSTIPPVGNPNLHGRHVGNQCQYGDYRGVWRDPKPGQLHIRNHDGHPKLNGPSYLDFNWAFSGYTVLLQSRDWKLAVRDLRFCNAPKPQ